MSGSIPACREGGHRHVVAVRRANYSRFNGSRWTPSAYSEVRCLATGRVWRTRAGYVASLPDASEADWDAIRRGDFPER